MSASSSSISTLSIQDPLSLPAPIVVQNPPFTIELTPSVQDRQAPLDPESSEPFFDSRNALNQSEVPEDISKDTEAPPAQAGVAIGFPLSEGNAEMSAGGYVAVCWGCNQHVALPVYYSVFRCGHCGALTYDYDKASIAAATGQPLDRRPRRSLTWSKIRDRITVGLVTILICVIITGCGLWAAFPVLFPSITPALIMNLFISAALCGNTLFNFFCCSCLPAGPLEPLPWGDVQRVPAGSLTDCTLCTQCFPPKPKPSRAHHCRQCGDCVMEMDHHCPFIGNCVGQSNQRHFIVFLVFATASCLYAALMVVLALRSHAKVLDFSEARHVVADLAISGTVKSFFAAIPRLIASLLFSVGIRGAALCYIFGICIGTATCTFVLFYQQMAYIFHGTTYVESLKQTRPVKPAEDAQNGGHAEADSLLSKSKGVVGNRSSWEQRMMQLRTVFGNGSIWTWLLPRIEAPPGARTSKHSKHLS